jgi:hypothetical protein
MAPFSGGHDFIVREGEGGGAGGMREKMEGNGLAKFSPNDRSNGSDDGPGIEMECFMGRAMILGPSLLCAASAGGRPAPGGGRSKFVGMNQEELNLIVMRSFSENALSD